MNINMKTKPALAVMTVGCALYAFSYARIIKTEREKRRQIQKNLELDLAAIRDAGSEMQKRIAEGKYEGVPLHNMLGDLETLTTFNKIAVRTEL